MRVIDRFLSNDGKWQMFYFTIAATNRQLLEKGPLIKAIVVKRRKKA